MSYQIQQRLEKRNHTKQRVAYELRMAKSCQKCGARPEFLSKEDGLFFICLNVGCRYYGRRYSGKTFVLARRNWDRNN